MERDRVPVPHTTKVSQRWAFSIHCSLSLSLEIEADHWFVVERADAESLAARLRKRVSEAYSSLGTRFSASLRPCVVNKHSMVRTRQHLGPRWNKPYCCRSSICAAHASRSRWTSTLHAIERAFSVASRSRSRHHSRSAGATSTGASCEAINRQPPPPYVSPVRGYVQLQMLGDIARSLSLAADRRGGADAQYAHH